MSETVNLKTSIPIMSGAAVGLATQVARERLAQMGPNEISTSKPKPLIFQLLACFIFVPLPPLYFVFLTGATLNYLGLVEVVKRRLSVQFPEHAFLPSPSYAEQRGWPRLPASSRIEPANSAGFNRKLYATLLSRPSGEL